MQACDRDAKTFIIFEKQLFNMYTVKSQMLIKWHKIEKKKYHVDMCSLSEQ